LKAEPFPEINIKMPKSLKKRDFYYDMLFDSWELVEEDDEEIELLCVKLDILQEINDKLKKRYYSNRSRNRYSNWQMFSNDVYKFLFDLII
jgi:hypothetical protein